MKFQDLLLVITQSLIPLLVTHFLRQKRTTVVKVFLFIPEVHTFREIKESPPPPKKKRRKLKRSKLKNETSTILRPDCILATESF